MSDSQERFHVRMEGDRAMTQRELRKARETVATLVRVQQQTDRLPAAAD
jgi:hypothetical protein